MSLILEALKKSEAERRLGHVPGLMTPSARPMGKTGRTWLPGFLLGLAVAVLVMAALAGWWWADRSGPTPEVAATSASAVADAPPLPATPATQDTAMAAEVSPAPSAPVTPTQRPTTTPAQVIARAPLPQDPEFAGTERESVAVPAGAIPLPPPVAVSAPTAATPAPAPAPAPQTTPTPVVSAAPSGPDMAAARPPAEPLEAVPLLAMLLPAQREGLPPLRLSMHVYDADPAARFVLIDGRRYRQGDAISDGLVVDAIRPDGALIARGGLRFLVARP